MKFNCDKCETTMEIVEGQHVCPDCSHTLSLQEADDLFEEGKIIGVLDESDDLEEGENPFAKKDDRKDDKSDDDDKGSDDKSDDKDKKKKKDDEEMDEDFDIDAIEVDVSEDVSAIFDGETLTEDFQTKAKTIFEAAIRSNVKKHLVGLKAVIEGNYEKKLAKEVDVMESDIDAMLDSIVEDWKKENELAIEHGVRTEMTEAFIVGLKDLFEEHYVEIPEDRYDLVQNLSTQVEEMRTELDTALTENIKMKKSLSESTSTEITKELSEGLADTDAEKFKDLAENVKFESEDQYREELNTLRESYFKAPVVKKKALDEDVDVGAVDNKDDKTKNTALSEALRMISTSQD